MVVSVNAVELASELAHQRVVENCFKLSTIEVEDENGDIGYVEEAQEEFNLQYDYYFTMITNLHEDELSKE